MVSVEIRLDIGRCCSCLNVILVTIASRAFFRSCRASHRSILQSAIRRSGDATEA